MKKFIFLIMMALIVFSAFAAFKFRGHTIVKSIRMTVNQNQQAVVFDEALTLNNYKVILITPGKDIRHYSMEILNKDVSGFDIKLFKDGEPVTGVRVVLYLTYN